MKGGSWNFTLCSPRLSEGCLLMKYALKRAAAGLATILIVSFLTYAAFDLISDAATAMLGTSATPEPTVPKPKIATLTILFSPPEFILSSVGAHIAFRFYPARISHLMTPVPADTWASTSSRES